MYIDESYLKLYISTNFIFRILLYLFRINSPKIYNYVNNFQKRYHLYIYVIKFKIH